MKIGIRAHDLGRGNFEQFEENIRRISNIGYDSIQLAPAKCINEIDGIPSLTEEQAHRIKVILDRHHISVSVLGCYLDFTSSDAKIRKKAKETFIQYIRYAKLLEADMIATETSYGVITEENREQAMSYVREAFADIIPIAEQEEVLVVIEPVATHALNTPNRTRDLIDHFSSDYFKILYDQTNLLTVDMMDQDDGMFERVIRNFGSDVKAIHVKNFVVCNGEKQMVAIEDGIVDMKRILSYAKQHWPDAVLIREDPAGADIERDYQYITHISQ